jgi:hypothetical protein
VHVKFLVTKFQVTDVGFFLEKALALTRDGGSHETGSLKPSPESDNGP